MTEPVGFILSTNLLQAGISLISALILFRLYRHYQRAYLKQWSLSWGALTLFLLLGSYALYGSGFLHPRDPRLLAASMIALTMGFWQPAWLLFGVCELAGGRSVGRGTRWAVLAALMLLGAIATLLYTRDPAALAERYAVRIGTRSFLTGLAFMAAGYLVWSRARVGLAVGRGLLGLSFVLYGLELVHHSATTLLPLLGAKGPVYAPYLGILHAFLQVMMALSLVIWPLEEERLRAEQASRELEHSREQLGVSQRMEAIGSLVAGVTHDFNNLLTVIAGYAGILRSRLSDDGPSNRDLEEILRAAERGTALNRQLLAFGARQALRPRVVNLNRTLEGVGRLLRPLIGEDVEVEISKGENLGNVEIDPVQIEQVIVNLAVNAREAMPRGGVLAIRSLNTAVAEPILAPTGKIEPGAWVRLSVRDSGVGMDQDTLQHVFEPYFTTREGKTGLGLATVFGIVRQSGGHILVESEPGRGTIFRIFFPLVEREACAEPGAPEAAQVDTGTETILLVEDDGPLRRLAQQVLESAGYQVIDAVDPRQAISLTRDGRDIDLILTDIVMPQMSGAALAREVARSCPRSRTLYMSGYPADALAAHDLSAGVPFLRKPFSPGDLLETVRRVLDG